MRDRTVLKYSACFKQQVVADLESGRFESIQAARMLTARPAVHPCVDIIPGALLTRLCFAAIVVRFVTAVHASPPRGIENMVLQ